MDDKPKLSGLQTEDQRRILDAITQIRKCGLEGVLSLPQIVVCGDQSAGKSSVMEALTGIPFPRNDNRCTRFATEISLRHETEHKLTVKVIPDSDRPLEAQEKIAQFSQSITDFADLPGIIDAAMEVMGIANPGGTPDRAFAKDTLSVHLEGPGQPHVTLVDIPGLISSQTKGVSDRDIAIVAEITEHYISQPRTICLAVIQATNDVANQSILQKVRKFDPKGQRSLGVVTKIDRLPIGSDTEASFLELAKNEDVVFKLGWHVVKNRTFEERHDSLEERNSSERDFFERSVFGQLSKDNIGIDALRFRLSGLLLEHVKTELPHLRNEAETALQKVKSEMSLLGNPRGTMEECRSYLIHLSMTCYEICKAGVHGNYEDQYFRYTSDMVSSLKSERKVARLRACVQHFNSLFSETLRNYGHKYAITLQKRPAHFFDDEELHETGSEQNISRVEDTPIILSEEDARKWVRRILLRSRGKELIGNFNPHLLNELFWEQSERWEKLATDHAKTIYHHCELFLAGILSRKAPRDIKDQFWSSIVGGALETRRKAAFDELDKLIKDKQSFLINYNHYYTEDLQNRRQNRLRTQLQDSFSDGIRAMKTELAIIDRVIDASQPKTTQDMEAFSCDEALDYLKSIYKVQQKTFIANVTTQVVERHIIRDLETVFSPSRVAILPDDVVKNIVAESPSTKEQRRLLQDRLGKLEEGLQILRNVVALSIIVPF